MSITVMIWLSSEVDSSRTSKKKVKSQGENLMTNLRAQSVRGILVEPPVEAKQDLHAYIESLFPTVFSNKPTMGRFLEELVANHMVLTAFMDKDRSERMISLYEFCCVMMQSFFIVALVTSLEIGSADECEVYFEKRTCISAASLTLTPTLTLTLTLTLTPTLALSRSISSLANGWVWPCYGRAWWTLSCRCGTLILF